MWNNITPKLSSLLADSRFPNQPDHITWMSSFQTALYGHSLSNFGRQLKTTFISPETGHHTFKMAVDNYGSLYIGTTEATKVKIINNVGYSSPQQYRYSSSPRYLVAGVGYYVEVIMVESNGGDNVASGVIFPSGNTAYPITDQYLISP